MNCFFCATPYHIIASMALASGTMSGDPSTLVVMDHFSMDDGMLDRIRSTGIFREVILYTSNNKTKWNKAKRLLSVFCPDQTIRKLAHKTAFSHCVFFALVFLNLGYMAKVYRKRGIPCEFSFGDDGAGNTGQACPLQCVGTGVIGDNQRDLTVGDLAGCFRIQQSLQIGAAAGN